MAAPINFSSDTSRGPYLHASDEALRDCGTEFAETNPADARGALHVILVAS